MPSAAYLVQEEDGTSRLTLEEGGGSLLLEDGSVPVTPVQPGGSHIIAVAPRVFEKRQSGKFRARAVRILVTPYAAVLQTSFGARSVATAFGTTPALARFSFVSKAAQEGLRFERHRPEDLEELIRRTIIADE